jgi:tetratricopeptide (TPR) repeat protein
MNIQNESSFLAKFACIFRDEGDAETADALDRQLQSTASRSLCERDGRRVRLLRRKAGRLDNLGAHEDAEPLLVDALRIVQDALGPEHIGIADDLNALARCRFNNGDYEAAVADYSRLARIVEQAYGSEEARTLIAKYSVERCRKGLSHAIGAMRLQSQMNWMLHQAQGMRAIETANQQERVRAVARRLMSRGRLAASSRWHERWITWRLSDAHPDDELAQIDCRDYAMALRGIGQLGRALSTFQQLVTLQNRRAALSGDKSGLLQALADWQACLAETGDMRSIRDTAALADSIANHNR